MILWGIPPVAAGCGADDHQQRHHPSGAHCNALRTVLALCWWGRWKGTAYFGHVWNASKWAILFGPKFEPNDWRLTGMKANESHHSHCVQIVRRHAASWWMARWRSGNGLSHAQVIFCEDMTNIWPTYFNIFQHPKINNNQHPNQLINTPINNNQHPNHRFHRTNTHQPALPCAPRRPSWTALRMFPA